MQETPGTLCPGFLVSAPGETRTPNLLIRSQEQCVVPVAMECDFSYEITRNRFPICLRV